MLNFKLQKLSSKKKKKTTKTYNLIFINNIAIDLRRI